MFALKVGVICCEKYQNKAFSTTYFQSYVTKLSIIFLVIQNFPIVKSENVTDIDKNSTITESNRRISEDTGYKRTILNQNDTILIIIRKLKINQP